MPKAIAQIENDPTWKQRLINAGKQGGLEFIKKNFDNPVGALIMRAFGKATSWRAKVRLKLKVKTLETCGLIIYQ